MISQSRKSDLQKQSGNILIYILGAIFLLGLLIITVRGSGTPGSNISEENLILKVTEVQQYGAELQNAVAFILNQRGVSEEDIRFAHPDAHAGYGVITSIPERQVFSRQGGGATYRAPPEDIQVIAGDWLFNAENNVAAVGSTNNADTDKDVELLAILPNVTEAFCLMINDLNNITNPSDSPPNDNGDVSFATRFAGTFSMVETIGDTGNILDGKSEGCFEGGGTPAAGTYHYYRALLVR